MLRLAIFSILFAGGLSASWSLNITGRSASANIKNQTVHAGDALLEFRFHTWTPPSSAISIYDDNTLRVQHLTSNTLRLMSPYDSACPNGNNYDLSLSNRTDIGVRIFRLRSLGKIVFKIWNTDGSGDVLTAERKCGTLPARTLQTITLGNAFAKGGQFAFLRLYGTPDAEAAPLPNLDTDAPPHLSSLTGNIANFEFEQSVSDTSGENCNLSWSNAAYASTPKYPPVCVATVTPDASDPTQVLLDGSTSYVNDLTHDGTLEYRWQVIERPPTSSPWWHRDDGSGQSTVRGLVFGKYVFALNVKQEDGRSATCMASHTAAPTDGRQPAPGVLALSVVPHEVAGSANVRFTLRDPNGNDVDQKVCSTMPCTLAAGDHSLGSHLLKVEHLSEDGEVLAAGAWQPVGITAAAASSPPPFSSKHDHIKVGAVIYAGSSEEVTQFLAKRIDLFVTPSKYATHDPRRYNPNAVMLEYKDFAGVYVDEETYAIRQFGKAHGYNEEDFYLHMDVDYTNVRWQEMSRFDKAERNPATSLYWKGVFTCTRSCNSFTDKTQAAFNTTAGDVPLTEWLYLGFSFPFDQARFSLSEARVGGSVGWEYWNGSAWSFLPLQKDDTEGLSVTGATLLPVTWIPPTDWEPRSVGGSKEKWWVRARVTGASTAPVANRILGDTWLTGTKSRGWATNNPGRIVCCGGRWEYDANPPAGATARFKFQARVHSFFGTRDAYLVNHSKTGANGKNPWAQYLVSAANDIITGSGWNGIMVDNLDSITERITAPEDWKNHLDWHWPYRDSEASSFIEFRAGLRDLLPRAIVGGNTGAFYPPVAVAGDMVLLEAFSTSKGERSYAATNYASFDNFLPANNPNGTRALIMINDNMVGTSSSDGGGAAMDGVDPAGRYFTWDKRNRRPIGALAYYYIGSNENTYFVYNAFGFQYSSTDEVRYHSTVTTTLAAPISKDPTTAVKTIKLTNATGFGSANMIIMIGGTVGGHDGEHILYDSKNGTILTHNDPIYNDWPAGTPVNLVTAGRQSAGTVDHDRVCYYATWFPAVGVDIGKPDTSGHNAGVRDTAWITGTSIGDGGGNIYRRDFTKAIVLFRPAAYNTTAAQYGTPQPSQPISLGTTLYPLRAGGRTGPPITSVQLRSGEGAILMKEPIP